MLWHKEVQNWLLTALEYIIGEFGTGKGGICTAGYYCGAGTTAPKPCPVGKYGATNGLKTEAECSLCLAGFYCDEVGLSAASLVVKNK